MGIVQVKIAPMSQVGIIPGEVVQSCPEMDFPCSRTQTLPKNTLLLTRQEYDSFYELVIGGSQVRHLKQIPHSCFGFLCTVTFSYCSNCHIIPSNVPKEGPLETRKYLLTELKVNYTSYSLLIESPNDYFS